METTIGSCRLIHGDCSQVKLTEEIAALVTDPPYGCKNNCDYTRFSGGLTEAGRQTHKTIAGDTQPFDPEPWLKYPQVVLFGYQFFAQTLPLGSLLVWLKKRDNQLGTFLSDCELAWQKGGKGCYLFRHTWHGFDRETERGKPLHPSQKPVALFQWILSNRLKLSPGQTVLDPYMGTAPLAIACEELGLKYVGIEIAEEYYLRAVDRVRRYHDGHERSSTKTEKD